MAKTLQAPSAEQRPDTNEEGGVELISTETAAPTGAITPLAVTAPAASPPPTNAGPEPARRSVQRSMPPSTRLAAVPVPQLSSDVIEVEDRPVVKPIPEPRNWIVSDGVRTARVKAREASSAKYGFMRHFGICDTNQNWSINLE